MRIIALEEHVIDPGLAKATQAAQAAEAGYMADLGGGDSPPKASNDRPTMAPMPQIMARAGDVGAGRIAEMDAHGIDMQVLSYSNATQLAAVDQGPDLARAANDKLAEAVRAYPGRFAGFATLPWQDPQAAEVELDRAVREGGFKGALLIGRPGQTFLDDPRYEPVLAKLTEMKVPLYVHPGAPLPQVQQPYYGGLAKTVTARLSLFGWGWHNEAGIQVTPRGMLNLPHFKFIHEVLGTDRILYAVDYPYLTNTGARRFLEQLPVSQADKEKIAHGNAEALLRL